MTIHITIAQTEDEKSLLAMKALDEHLFVNGWMLQGELLKIKRHETVKFAEICLAKKDDEVVGVALYFTPDSKDHTFGANSVICYVRPTHRREGIGTKLVNGFGVDTSIMKSYMGTEYSPSFWRAVKTNYQGVFVW